MALIFKDDKRLREEFFLLTPKTQLILVDVVYWCAQRDLHFVATCFGRTYEERLELVKRGLAKNVTSVHELWRGFDGRVLFPDELNQQLIDYVNVKYPYDPNRPRMKTAIRHVGTADHLHFQSLV